MEIFKQISKNPKEAARELYMYISTFETDIICGSAEIGFSDYKENLSQNCVLNLCISIINMQIECCSGLYDELLSVEYGKFEEQDVERYNWLCKIRKHLESNFDDNFNEL
jgi:hypothetical protein